MEVSSKKGYACMRFLLSLGFVCILLLQASCGSEKRDYAERLSEFEPREYEDREVTEEKIKELEQKISELKKDVERTIEATYDLAVYNKMLALEYIELEMYGPALEALRKAIEISPANRLLFYYAGVCSAQMSKSTNLETERKRYLEDAEFYYSRAIELKNNYVEALFGLAVIYVFELDRPLDAKGLLEDVLRYSSSNTQAMFLLARVNVQLGDVETAIDLYERIEENSAIDTERQEAASNKQQLLEEYYGS
jgi:tetratricopeptide (TPR) repeat protein